ncbi:MAG TPA: hypothetical protein VKR60_02150 [Candidatus Sulfotelmatobacter sp.]|nr:hypothetical protein [Candidatus Sulfotelmatobacter sp.]
MGLNNVPPSRRNEKLAPDPSLQTSQDLDYLLEEERERSGGWKYVLMLLALALAVGFGYLRWSGQGLAGLMSSTKRPASASASKPTATPSSPDAAATQPAPAPDATTPASGAAGSPSSTGAPAGTTDAGNAAPAGNPATPNPAPATPAAANPVPGSAPPASAAATDAASNAPASAAAASDAPPDKDKDKNDQPAAAEPVAKPAAKPKPPAPKRVPEPADAVVVAEKYIYGRGVPQDCDRGMKTLRPSAARGNAKAMISLGALYATGVCAPRDLPTAYHWFALALRKQPNDQPLQDNMQKLWGQMTQPERQLAIRLSQ